MSEPCAGLYLHVPFCARVCPYCDFAVRTGDADRRRRYVDHLLLEIALHSACPLRFDTIYFGGGTPSLLEPAEISRILDTLGRHLTLAEHAWVFLEANPEDVTAESVAAWRDLGVDTLSLGVQSLDAERLAFLGRRHTAEDARRATRMARAAGFRTVSADLIYGLPGQTVSSWCSELDDALTLEIDHLSCYQLTIHERTRFALLEQRGRLVQLSPDEQGELFRATHRHLDAAGLTGYEVSQFAAAPEHRSRHNRKYWDHTPYLGFGPSAHSFHADKRWWNLRGTDAWQERVARGEAPIEDSETLDPGTLALEALMTGLRTHAGVDLVSLSKRFDVDLAATNRELLRRLAAEGLASLENDHLVPTLDGLAVADTLAILFDLGPDRGHSACPPCLDRGNLDRAESAERG